jgi:hypothetical protein
VATAVFAIGPTGLKDADLAGLLRVMDDRLKAHAAYLAPGAEDTVTASRGPADSALAAATDVPLDQVVWRPDPAAPATSTATFRRDDGAPVFEVAAQGWGLTFPIGGSDVLTVSTTVTLHQNDAQALHRVLAAERAGAKRLTTSVMDAPQMGQMPDLATGGDSTVLEWRPAPPSGGRAVALRARLRGLFRSDIDAVVFALGRVSVRVSVSRMPGVGDSSLADSLALELDRRIRRLVAGIPAAAPAARLVEAVRRVADAEHVVDSLGDAREIDAMFRAIDGARLARAPVSFTAGTWNGVCWWGALYGQVQRALPACEAAVAPDTTDLAIRDSRGLARALGGDLEGARQDFEYIVAHAAAGPFLDRRAAWLEALRAGTNPFTQEVLADLKKQ